MSQPPYVHVGASDEVRPVERLPAASTWVQSRVAELVRPGQPRGGMYGDQGPDQGYALHLATLFQGELASAAGGDAFPGGESHEDVLAGCVGVALARASIFGRAPVKADLEFAFTLFGYLGGEGGSGTQAPQDLVKRRGEWFRGCAEDYWQRLAIKALVPDETLRLAPAQVRARLSDWPSLLG